MSLSAILAAIDFSPSSRDAVRVAGLIARRHGATLTLLHVDRMPELVERIGMSAPANVWGSYLGGRADAVHRMLEGLAGSVVGVETRTVVARDEVGRAIIERAAHDRSGLIALGAHGAGSTRRHAWLGSVPFEVAANSPCPVLIVRERGIPADERGFRKPLIAVGLEGPIDAAVAFASLLCADDATFHFVHVSEWPAAYRPPATPTAVAEAHRRALAERAAWLKAEASRLRGGPNEVHFEEADSASEAILDRVQREGHDVVVVGQRPTAKPSGVLGPASRRLLEYADVSVAVIRPS